MDDDQFSVVVSKLNSIIKLLALNSLQGKTLRDQVAFLSSTGFQPKEIAEVLGKTPNHISVILHEIRKSANPSKEPTIDSQTQSPDEGARTL